MYDVSVTMIDDVSDDALDGRLEERSEPPFLPEHPFAVVECARDAPVSRAARHLIDDVEAHPDHELEGQMRPAAGQAPRGLSDESSTRPADSSGPISGGLPGSERSPVLGAYETSARM